MIGWSLSSSSIFLSPIPWSLCYLDRRHVGLYNWFKAHRTIWLAGLSLVSAFGSKSFWHLPFSRPSTHTYLVVSSSTSGIGNFIFCIESLPPPTRGVRAMNGTSSIIAILVPTIRSDCQGTVERTVGRTGGMGVKGLECNQQLDFSVRLSSLSLGQLLHLSAYAFLSGYIRGSPIAGYDQSLVNFLPAFWFFTEAASRELPACIMIITCFLTGKEIFMSFGYFLSYI